jgi:pimeloyl-ACP methyl ester carboxylesterase
MAKGLGLLLLHALPFDGSMWAKQMGLLPDSTYAPTLYSLGDSVARWAQSALKLTSDHRLIVVGCSVGGSCALEVAVAAPDRVAALVLIGTKARHRPDPALHGSAVETLRNGGLQEAWSRFWLPLFSKTATDDVLDEARRILLSQSPDDLARGVTAFHSRPSRSEFLSRFPRQIVFVSGAEDTAPGPAVSAAQAKAAHCGSLHIVPDCGHYVPLERFDYLNTVLTELIAAHR